jgi:hypothetical protein
VRLSPTTSAAKIAPPLTHHGSFMTARFRPDFGLIPIFLEGQIIGLAATQPPDRQQLIESAAASLTMLDADRKDQALAS